MTLMMNQEGEKVSVVEAPTYIVTPRTTAPEVSSGSGKGIQKKHVLIVVGVTVLAGLIITGILVGLYIFAEAQKEIVKFSLNFKSETDGSNVKQEVESDPNDNVVKYTITKDGKNVDIVNDFNKGMQVVRMEFDSRMSCFVSALNRSAAVDPSQITGPDHNTNAANSSSAGSTVYQVSSSPVTDRSFLPKKALDMCKDVSLYWAYRTCSSDKSEESDSPSRQRRGWYCITSCGRTVCSPCGVRLTRTYLGNGWYYCQFYKYC